MTKYSAKRLTTSEMVSHDNLIIDITQCFYDTRSSLREAILLYVHHPRKGEVGRLHCV